MKYAECPNKKAEQNSSYCSFFDLETSPLLLYYYIIIYRQRHFLQNSNEKKNKICLCRPKQNINNDGECSKSSKKDDEGFSIF